MLTEDIGKIVAIVTPNLRSYKAYIRVFTAETIAFLFRKVKDSKSRQKVFEDLFCELQDNESLHFSEGIAVLLFEISKQVNGNVHSNFTSFFREAIAAALNAECPEITTPTLRMMVTLISHHIDEANYDDFVARILGVWDSLKEQYSVDAELNVLLLDLLSEIAAMHKGAMISDRKNMFTVVTRVIESDRNTDSVVSKALEFASALFYPASLESSLLHGKPLLDMLPTLSASHVFSFTESLRLRKWRHFPKIAVPFVVKSFEKSTDPYHAALVLHSMLNDESLDLMGNIPYQLRVHGGMMRLSTDSSDPVTLFIQRRLQDLCDFSVFDLDEINQLVVFSQLAAKLAYNSSIDVFYTTALRSLSSLIVSSDTETRTNTDSISISNRYALGSAVGAVLESWAYRSRILKEFKALSESWSSVLELIPHVSENPQALKGLSLAAETLNMSDDVKATIFSEAEFEKIYTLLLPSVGSVSQQVRLFALKILRFYPQQKLLANKDSVLEGECPVIIRFPAMLRLILFSLLASFLTLKPFLKVLPRFVRK